MHLTSNQNRKKLSWLFLNVQKENDMKRAKR